MSYQKTKEFERLSFLYLLTGNTEKLRKMLKIAEMRGDVMSCVHNALFLGDAEEKVKVLESTGQLSLAYLAARTHGLDEQADRLEEHLRSANIPIPTVNPDASLLSPPTPIIRSENWPLLAVNQSSMSAFTAAGDGKTTGVSSIGVDVDDGEFHDSSTGGGGGWDVDLDDDEDVVKKPTAAAAGGGGGGGKKEKDGKGWEDDLDLSDDDEADAGPATSTSAAGGAAGGAGGYFVAPTPGNLPFLSWYADSAHCADHFAAGSVESGIQLLSRQIAASSILPLKEGALSLHLGSVGFLPGLPLVPSNRSYMVKDAGKGKTTPMLTLKVTPLLEWLKLAYRAFTSAQFVECQEYLEKIIKAIPLVNAATKSEVTDLKELLDVSREYLIALKVKTAMDEATADVGRSLELAAYFTHCNLQPAHLTLALKTAMANAFKNKVYSYVLCVLCVFYVMFMMCFYCVIVL